MPVALWHYEWWEERENLSNTIRIMAWFSSCVFRDGVAVNSALVRSRSGTRLVSSFLHWGFTAHGAQCAFVFFSQTYFFPLNVFT